jgi:hypothetical protein
MRKFQHEAVFNIHRQEPERPIMSKLGLVDEDRTKPLGQAIVGRSDQIGIR